MSYQEKPKRSDYYEDSMGEIVRAFHLRLFMYLMIPALILGFIFAVPVIFLNNLPDRLNANCTVFEGDKGIRIVSQTTRTNVTRIFWTDNHGVTWRNIETIEQSYQTARADCDDIDLTNTVIRLTIGSEAIQISSDGEILR